MAPEDHFRLIYYESLFIGRSQARPLSHHAVDILGAPAAAADQVMMTVPHPTLETCGMPRGLDPPQQARVGTRDQHVVDGLPGQRAELALVTITTP